MKTLKIILAAVTLFVANIASADSQSGMFEGSVQTIRLDGKTQYRPGYFGDNHFKQYSAIADSWVKARKGYQVKVGKTTIKFQHPPIWYYNLNIKSENITNHFRIALCGTNGETSNGGQTGYYDSIPWVCVGVTDADSKMVLLFTKGSATNPDYYLQDAIGHQKSRIYENNEWGEFAGSDYACSPMLKGDYCPSYDEIKEASPDNHDI